MVPAADLSEVSDLLTAAVALVIGSHDEELARVVVPELDRVRSLLVQRDLTGVGLASPTLA
jgi:hypothetical protein